MAKQEVVRPTREELQAQVNEEIPYVVGDGKKCLNARTQRLRVLYRKYGYSITGAANSKFVLNPWGNTTVHSED